MDLRLYTPADRDACLAIFDSNTPAYFAPAERDEYAAFLAAPPGEYYVAEHDGAVIGCGGFALNAPAPARLTWGMVHRDWQGKGVGRLLLLYRLRQLSRVAPGAEFVALATTPAAQGFYEKLGFRAVSTDSRADGLVEMVKRLAVCG